MRPHLTLLVFALSATLFACQGPVALVVPPEVAELKPFLSTLLPQLEKQTGLGYRLVETLEEGERPTDAVVFAAGDPTPEALVGLPSVAPQTLEGRSLAPRLLRPGRALPLFWDVAGVTVFAQELPEGTPEGAQTWTEPAAGWPRVKTLVVAGGEPDLRLMAWLGQSGNDGSLPSPRAVQVFASWLSTAAWTNDAWRLTRADVAQTYRGGRSEAFLETFRDFYRANPPGFRRFFPLVAGTQARPSVAGSVLSLDARGGEAAAKAGLAWALALTTVEFQRDFSRKTGWMPANFAAPVLETASAESRKVLLRASAFTPTAAVTGAVRDQLELLFQSPARLSR